MEVLVLVVLVVVVVDVELVVAVVIVEWVEFENLFEPKLKAVVVIG